MRSIALMIVVGSLAAGAVQAKDSLYLSLMGEPFWPKESGEAPFDQWFSLADQDGNGSISMVEFQRDAESFFTNLDTTEDKVIDGDEMAVYEQMAPGRTRAAGGGAKLPSSARPKAQSSSPVEKGQVAVVTGGDAPSATRIHPGGGRIDFSSVPQPVAMADLNIDRRVTLAEFLKVAGRRFANYDVDKNGQLSRKELQ